ncbi:MAG: carboxymuconolactone decarboxylase family protein [Fibrobacteria bacterium]|nr:carboxymuconolactone decarboxylase family protein [Fibrobacteria bacterium]
MSPANPGVSDAFQLFFTEAPAHAKAWMEAVQSLNRASALDPKTGHLAYLAVLSALGLDSGVPFHADLARQAGATRDEVVGAVLVGLPAAGNVVVKSLPPALSAFQTIEA